MCVCVCVCVCVCGGGRGGEFTLMSFLEFRLAKKCFFQPSYSDLEVHEYRASSVDLSISAANSFDRLYIAGSLFTKDDLPTDYE